MRSRACAVFLVMALTACTKSKAELPTRERIEVESAAEGGALEAGAPGVEVPVEPETAPEPGPTPALAADTEVEPAHPLDLAEQTKQAAGEGFTVGPTPELTPHENSSSEGARASLEREGATVTASGHVEPVDEFEYRTTLQVRVSFAQLPGDERGLNYAAPGDDYCDNLVPEVQELFVLDDGRWLVDAQLACRAGEDYFSATNIHTLILVDPARPRADVVWTGEDSGEAAMGVCSSSSVSSFELDGGSVIVRRTELTTLDRAAAKELPEAAEGCKPKPETTSELARVNLALGREL